MTPDQLNRFLAEAFPDTTVPYRVEAVTGAGVRLRLPVAAEHGRPGGSVMGPTMMSLADGAAWTATLSRIGPVALSLTSSLTINFLRRPPLDAHLLGEAELLRLGRRLSVTDVRILSEASGALVAQASVTYSIPAP